ncbi:MAG: hypothetical protein HON90_07010, partial [Halobacteriovoraceae bacterium]|nr:hypothetical protein [Halobacteriovoraceae bacterium]
MKKQLMGAVLIFISTTLFAGFNNSGYEEALKRRELFKESVPPASSDLNLNNYLNCISYDLRSGKKHTAIAAEYFKQKSSDSYYSSGIGMSKFDTSTYKLSKNGLSAIVSENNNTHIKTFRVTTDGFLLLEIATSKKFSSQTKLPTSVIGLKHQAVIYGVCEYNYQV